DSAATFECLSNHGANVDRPGADYIALEAAGHHALVTLADHKLLNMSFWSTDLQESNAVSQYKAVGSDLAKSGDALLVWDVAPSPRDRLTVKRCLLMPAAAKRPSSTQKSAISLVIHADSRDISHPDRVTVSGVRLSGHDPSFALADISEK